MAGQLAAFGICGYSGSGKTTLILKLIGRLTAGGLDVAVLKHDVHGLNIDREGKDSDRFFKAGADVILRGPEQSFLRTHKTNRSDLSGLLKLLAPRYDVVLVEGHRSTPLLDKVWLLDDSGADRPPAEAADVRLVLRRDEDRVRAVAALLDDWLPAVWLRTPVYAGLLCGRCGARRAGALAAALRPFVSTVALLGGGGIPDGAGEFAALPAAPDVRGPRAEVLSAMRWAPMTGWIFVDAALSPMPATAVEWLLAERQPGVWAVLPELPDADPETPPLAYCDFRAQPLLEATGSVSEFARSPKVVTPRLPVELRKAWSDQDTSPPD